MMLESQIPEGTPEDQLFQLEPGVFVRTGNLVPDSPPTVSKSAVDIVGILAKDQVAKLIAGRKSARERFDASWIKNQGRRGSCNAYACASVIERTRGARRLKRVELGPEFMYAAINHGRDNGSQLKDAADFASSVGCPPKEFVKYESYLQREQSPEARANAPRFRVEEWMAITNEAELATCLALGFYVDLAVHVTDDWMKLDGNGVVYPTNGDGNHAICVDDVRINARGEYEFDHAGSWSTRYGQQGRGWITWNRHLRGPIRNHVFWACRTCVDDPEGDDKIAA